MSALRTSRRQSGALANLFRVAKAFGFSAGFYRLVVRFAEDMMHVCTVARLKDL